MKNNNTFVIIGNSAAGLAGIEAIREVDSVSRIINISREPYRPYSRCLLSYYLAGSIGKERLWLRPENYYADLKVDEVLGKEVVFIDEKNKSVKLSDGKKINYDNLLFSAGASSKSVDVKGIEKKGAFYLRTLDDAEGILAMLKEVKDVVILGGGLIGLRAACALRKQDKQVHVVVKSDHILSQLVDLESADMIRRHLQINGVKISTGLAAKEIFGKKGVEGILLEDGNRIDCQLVIIGKGVSPNTSVLEEKVEIDQGIIVDEYLKTSDMAIYAAGDVAETFDLFEEGPAINAIWPAAVRQGKIAGLNMAGRKTKYEGSCGMNSLDFFGMSIISFGVSRPKKDEYEELIQADFSKDVYRKVVLKDNKIKGAVFINDVEKHGIILNLALQDINISDIRDMLVDEYFDYGKIVPLMKRQGGRIKRPEYRDTHLTCDESEERICLR